MKQTRLITTIKFLLVAHLLTTGAAAGGIYAVDVRPSVKRHELRGGQVIDVVIRKEASNPDAMANPGEVVLVYHLDGMPVDKHRVSRFPYVFSRNFRGLSKREYRIRVDVENASEDVLLHSQSFEVRLRPLEVRAVQ